MDFILLGDAACSDVLGIVAAACEIVPVVVGTTFADTAPCGPVTTTDTLEAVESLHPGANAREEYEDVGGRSMVARFVLGEMGTSVCVVPFRMGSSIH